MLPERFTAQFLRQLELLRIRARRRYLGTRQGGHLSPKRGHGIEFSDYRKYELGDDPRHIDWGVYARSDRLYVKQFQEEQDLSVLIILDGSPSMYHQGETEKWSFARDTALALAYIALMQQDRVVVSVPGYYLSAGFQGPRAIHELSRQLNAIRLDKNPNLIRGVQQALSAIRFPGIVFFLSDLLMPFGDIETIFNLLRSKNLDIHSIQILGERDIDPDYQQESVIAVDSETGEELELALEGEDREEYGHVLVEHNHAISQFFASARIRHALANASTSVSTFMLDTLPRTGLVGA